MFDFEGGPFDSEDDFNHVLLSGTFRSTPAILKNVALRSLRTDHEVVFTHNDFSPRNITVKYGQVTGILDWEYSGRYPESWEFVKAFNVADHRVTWYDYVELMFPNI